MTAAFFAVISLAADPSAAGQPERPVIGRVEKVWLKDADTVVTGKIDTGTRTASLHADTISAFRRDGVDWVRFSFRDDAGKAHALSRRVVRFGKFKNSGLGSDVRPVVTLGLCIGTVYRRTEVNLVDRGKFSFRLLIGRRFLSKRLVVDTAKRMTRQPDCRAASRMDSE